MSKAVRAGVTVKNNNVDWAIKELRRKVASEEVLLTYMDRRFYKSKSQKAREDKERAIRREQRKKRRDEAVKLY